MWLIFAFGSAIFAGITSILAKCGIRKTDSTVATAIRTVVVLAFSWLMVFVAGSQNQVSSINGSVIYAPGIILSSVYLHQKLGLTLPAILYPSPKTEGNLYENAATPDSPSAPIPTPLARDRIAQRKLLETLWHRSCKEKAKT